jgi:protein-S-isoprenylcysteine O-methyltransferase Ste14
MSFVQQKGDRFSQQVLAAMGLGGFVVAFGISQFWKSASVSTLVWISLFCVAAPMVLANLWGNRTYLRPSCGLTKFAGIIHWPRILVKYLGLFGTGALLWTVYQLPFYSTSFYEPAWKCAELFAWPGILLAIIYIPWVDGRMADPEDELYSAGLFFAARWKKVNWTGLWEHTRGWIVKGFFVPFMLAGMAAHISFLKAEGMRFDDFSYLYATSLNLIYGIDVAFGTIGYLLTLRILDGHIRSVQPTLLGWVVTLICYPPFSQIRKELHLSHASSVDWQSWLVPHPIIFITWGFLILILHVIYVWSGMSFACRFSNLTNRGIITSGPFRWFKHPAYLSKNIAWWLMFVPFISQASALDALLACFSLGLTNFFYLLRAKTEEAHLREDPAYRVYSRWVAKYGLIAQLLRHGRRLIILPWKPICIRE